MRKQTGRGIVKAKKTTETVVDSAFYGKVRGVRSKKSTTKLSSKSRVAPKAFTENGLYMLATILKSKRAVAATFAIIETFAKVRGLKRELVELHKEAA